MDMGKEIRRLRNARGLTQEALAAALNVTAQTVSKWELGNSIPDVQMLPEIAVFFGVSIDQLFAMSPEQQMERIENHIYDRRLAEARQWLEKLTAIDSSYRIPMYRYLIALAEGECGEAENTLRALEVMEGQDWGWALTLGDICTQRQEYDRAIEWYRRGQEMQPSPKYTDAATSIAHICEIRGDRAGAIAAYREVLRLLREDWGIVSGDTYEEVERAMQKLR